MSNPKILVTAGCSFSQVPSKDITWPIHLQNILQTEQVYYLGQGAAGNGIISRKIIFTIENLLQNYDAQDLLVGIMWTARNRFEIYSEKFIPHQKINTSDSFRNPIAVAEKENYYLVTHHWKDNTSMNWFKYFYNDFNATIITLEHILRTQWYLDTKKIKYFMCQAFDSSLVSKQEKDLIINKDIKHLYDCINLNNWIYDENFSNMYQFSLDSGLPFSRPPDKHPSTEHHRLFVEQKVLPMLTNKKYFVQTL